VALARVRQLTYRYPGAERPALDSVSLELRPGEVVCLLGPSGGGKSTLLRALAGLVPHFHGGVLSGSVEIRGIDTRRARPAELAGTVASVFQDPEDQVVLTGVGAEIAFGLENVGTPPHQIEPRASAALDSVGAGHLFARRTQELSAGELQRVCIAAALALDPQLLLLDEPTSQLDPDGAEDMLDVACSARAVLLSEQRPTLALERCDRVLFLEGGRLLLDAPRDEALLWLAEHRPAYLPEVRFASGMEDLGSGEPLVRLEHVSYSYGARHAVGPASLTLRRGEIVALQGHNGSGKTTLAKLAAGLLEPAAGAAELRGRAAYLSQDPGRYLVCERVDEEVALGVGGDLERARRALEIVELTGYDSRHPRDLSSGERERLGLAAVLVTEPDVLILDEPTRGVDPERKALLARVLRGNAGRRATLVVTHDPVLAADVADRSVRLGPVQEPARV
jgi:energy-coupling factor transport system ATP-binding protein